MACRSAQAVTYRALAQSAGYQVRSNLPFKLTRSGSRRRADPGAGGIFPSAAQRRLPPRAA